MSRSALPSDSSAGPPDPATVGPGAWIDAAPVAMLIADVGGTIIAANQTAATIFRLPTDKLVGSPIERLVPTGFRADHGRHVEAFFRDMVPRIMGVGREVRAVDGDGREFPVEIGLSPVATPAGRYVVAAVVDITQRKKRERESTLARLVQEAMLPKIPTDLRGLDVAARSDPADATGGDFYDLVRFDDGRTGLVIGDASGHGFAAALVTAAARSYMRALLRTQADIGVVMRMANSLLIDDVSDNRFVTLLVTLFDPATRRLSYAGAGHAAYVCDASGNLRVVLDDTGPPLGWFADALYPVTEMTLDPGDFLLLLTDGIEEAFDPAGRQFGRQRVIDVLRRTHDQPVARIVEAIHRTVRDFHGAASPHDDATVLVARID